MLTYPKFQPARMSKDRTLRAVIVDDEDHCVRTLSWELEAAEPACELLASYTDSTTALAQIPELDFDVLFLDIEMPQLNGFQLLTRLREAKYKLPFVIFTTAYSDYAIRAFRFSAVDYLLKPVSRDELNDALKRVPSTSAGPEASAQDPALLKVLFDNIDNAANGRAMRLSLPTSDGWELVPIEQIIRCQSDGSYTVVYLHGGAKITVSRNLKQLDESLQSVAFHRVHNSHLINLNHVSRFIRQDGGVLVMSDGSTVAVSRSRRDSVLDLIR